ncbi:hypothetical protein AVEN_54555-1 [Araneus ventricosus]|uniref:Uncharacterized protein n=1 Tax=Araneus ventricosus TaxID=182803 RepID=A0A4Y2BKV6_ARAVE|nr:hypothetical protein AVEN_54555-1 [Araneus ventricosus]
MQRHHIATIRQTPRVNTTDTFSAVSRIRRSRPVWAAVAQCRLTSSMEENKETEDEEEEKAILKEKSEDDDFGSFQQEIELRR